MLLKDRSLLQVKNYRGGLAIHQAISLNGLDLAKLLIYFGSEMNQKDSFGRTALDLAYI